MTKISGLGGCYVRCSLRLKGVPQENVTEYRYFDLMGLDLEQAETILREALELRYKSKPAPFSVRRISPVNGAGKGRRKRDGG